MQIPTPQIVPFLPTGAQPLGTTTPVRRTVKRRRTQLRDAEAFVFAAESVSGKQPDPTQDPLCYQAPTQVASPEALQNQPTLIEMISKLTKFFETQGGNANRLLEEMVSVGNDFEHYTQMAVLKQNSVQEIKKQLEAEQSNDIMMTIVGDLVGIIMAVSIGALIGGPAGALAGLAVGIANAALSFPYKKGFTPYGWLSNKMAGGLGLKGKDRAWFDFSMKIVFATAVGIAAGGVTGLYYAGLEATETAAETAAEDAAEDAVADESGLLNKVSKLGKIYKLGLQQVKEDFSLEYIGKELDPRAALRALGRKILSLGTSVRGIFSSGAEDDAATEGDVAEEGAPGTATNRSSHWLRRGLYVGLDNFNTIANSFTSDTTGTAKMKHGKVVGTSYSDEGSSTLWSDMFEGMGVSAHLAGYLSLIPQQALNLTLIIGSMGGSQLFGETLEGGGLGFMQKFMPYIQYLGVAGNVAYAGGTAYENGVQIDLLEKVGNRAKEAAIFQKKATDIEAINQAIHTMLSRMSDQTNDLMGTIRTILDGIPAIFRDIQV